MFDTLLFSFVEAITAGFITLHMYAIPLLFLAANLAWLRSMWPSIRAGMHLNEVFAHAVLMALTIAVYVVLLLNLRDFAMGVFDFAVFLGSAASGGVISATQLMHPSGVFEAGATAATPILDYMDRMKGWTALKNVHILLQYSIAYVIVIAAFVGIALNISLTIIEFHFALLCATVLVPWAALAPTAFLAEFGLGWLVGMVVRLLIQTAVIGISLPLFELLTVETTAGGDPQFWSAVLLVTGSLFFFVLAWIIPNRATSIAARGMALGIGGDAISAGFSNASRAIGGFYRGATTVVTGATSLMRSQRTATV